MLQLINDENYRKIREWRNQADVRAMMFTKHEISEEEHHAWWKMIRDDQSKRWLMFSSQGVDLGVVYFTDIDYNQKTAHWGFYLADNAWFEYNRVSKRRIWLDVENEALEHAEQILGLEQLCCEVLAGNKAVIKLHEKSGFEEIAHTHTGSSALSITVLSDRESWLNPWIGELLAEWASVGHLVRWVHEPKEIPEGELCFILSCSKLVKPEVLKRNRHNLVVHESDLPQGKGWSPMTWQVLEGCAEIPVTLFEAANAVDSGAVYLQDRIRLDGTELVDELRAKQATSTLSLCRAFVDDYPLVLQKARAQHGEESFYQRRKPQDSRLDPDKTIGEQFDLLRVVDNERYPAFFERNGCRYLIKIEKTETR